METEDVKRKKKEAKENAKKEEIKAANRLNNINQNTMNVAGKHSVDNLEINSYRCGRLVHLSL